MELVLFFWFRAVCLPPVFPTFPGTRANHLKRRLSSIKRLEIFKGVFSTQRCVCVWVFGSLVCSSFVSLAKMAWVSQTGYRQDIRSGRKKYRRRISGSISNFPIKITSNVILGWVGWFTDFGPIPLAKRTIGRKGEKGSGHTGEFVSANWNLCARVKRISLAGDEKDGDEVHSAIEYICST